jgi:hypothetical protein
MTSKKETRISTWPYQCEPQLAQLDQESTFNFEPKFARFTSKRLARMEHSWTKSELEKSQGICIE